MWRQLPAIAALFAAFGPAHADTITADAAFSAGDYATAYREWSQAAGIGDASAMAAVGTLYDTGVGVSQDFGKALEWYQQAAKAGNVRGMFNTGVMYDNGRGAPASRAQALLWYTRAAEQGHGRAAFNAGLIYRDGDGVPRDRTAAVRYFRIAAQDGIQAARTNLVALQATEPALVPSARPAPPKPSAQQLFRARQLPLDADKPAILRLQKAALSRSPLDAGAVRELSSLLPLFQAQAGKGVWIAQYNVGYAYENGYGVPRNPVQSYVSYLRASASPDRILYAAALRGAAEVAKGLTDVQRAVARDMLLDGTP